MAENDKGEKNYTYQGALSEIRRLDEKISKRAEMIEAYKAEIADLQAQRKQLTGILEKLKIEETQRAVERLWFRQHHLTDAQIGKLLEIANASEPLEYLSAEEILRALTDAYEDKKLQTPAEEAVSEPESVVSDIKNDIGKDDVA